MSLIVVGTDTEVGKTVASAVILARYARGRRIAYWKPIATGAAEGLSDRERVARWVGGVAEVLPETYRFDLPASPHLAARRAGSRVDPERVLEDLVAHGLADAERHLVIEGIGGVLVPLTESGCLLIDLVADLSLPCVVVARSTLGTINHSLLTIEALRKRSIDIAGFVLSGPADAENRVAIERFGGVRVIGEIPPLGRLGQRSIGRAAKAFDVAGLLEEYFK